MSAVSLVWKYLNFLEYMSSSLFHKSFINVPFLDFNNNDCAVLCIYQIIHFLVIV